MFYAPTYNTKHSENADRAKTISFLFSLANMRVRSASGLILEVIGIIPATATADALEKRMGPP